MNAYALIVAALQMLTKNNQQRKTQVPVNGKGAEKEKKRNARSENHSKRAKVESAKES